MSRRHEITLTQLRYFATAAERRSMTEAARELFVAQSAVSAAIGQLAQQVGTQLFIRQGSPWVSRGREIRHVLVGKRATYCACVGARLISGQH